MMAYGVRARVLAHGSMAALALALHGMASAACTDTTPYQLTCTGTTANGISITPRGAAVQVGSGATVEAGSAAAAFSTEGRRMEFNILGTVDGGTKPGIIALSGSPTDQSESIVMLLTVARGGIVRGDTAVQFGQTSGNTSRAPFYLYNSGAITGTSGLSMVANSADSYFQIFTNSSSGVISGGVVGTVVELQNTGIIDGGANSAIRELVGSDIPTFLTRKYDNSGTIRSSGSAATLDIAQALSITNNAAISNSGSGAAIRAVEQLTIRNSGAISSAGGVAIDAGALSLSNSGIINGDIQTLSAAAGTRSTIVNTSGTINGSIRFGAGDDVYFGRTDAAGNFIGLTGTVDGGAGIDTIFRDISGTADVGAITLPTSFERLGLNLINAELTVATAPSFSAGFAFAGTGTVAINTDMSGVAPLIARSPTALESVTGVRVSNNATLTMALSTPAIGVDTDAVSFTNSGTIAVTGGDGVRFGRALTNSGTITSTGLAVSSLTTYGEPLKVGVFLTDSLFSNQGTVRSTGATAVTYDRGRITNSGTIEGAINGVILNAASSPTDFSYASVNNSGTITGGTNGLLLSRRNLGVTNDATGIIRGGVLADATNIGDWQIINRGRIEGNVNISTLTRGARVSNVGGTITGNVQLGSGDDVFAADLGGTSGVGGTIDAGAGIDTIAYRVTGVATTDGAPAPTFERVAYHLSDGATLTITAANPLNQTLNLGGDGKVDLNATISTTNASAVDASNSLYQLFPASTTETGLSVVNRGTLSTSSNALSTTSVLNGQSDTQIENIGTINGINSGSQEMFGIYRAAKVTNSGTINVTNGIGIFDVPTVINTGSILSGNGGRGVVSATTLTNSGTISVSGTAASANSIDNSGLLESRDNTALRSSGVITNAAGGTIRGGNGIAIESNGTTVINQGSIVGNVRLGTITGFRVPTSNNIYVAAPGSTLTGNLTFGNGDDIFLQRGSSSGISGTVDGGGGTDYYGRSFTSSAVYTLGSALPATFERDAIEASGTSTVVTLTGPAQTTPLYILGDGTIVNQVNIASDVVGLNTLGYSTGVSMKSFTNTATISGAVTGSISELTNSGNIGSSTIARPIWISGSGSLSLINSGTITASPELSSGASLSIDEMRGFSVTNAGAINAGVSVSGTIARDAANGAFNFSNSGTMSSASTLGGTVDIRITSALAPSPAQSGNLVTITNSGTITATGQGSTGARLATPGTEQIDALIVNSGQIVANGPARVLAMPFFTFAEPGIGVSIDSDDFSRPFKVTRVRNSGTITASAEGGVGVALRAGTLDLENSGTINGGATMILGPTGQTRYGLRDTIGGSILSAEGDDRILNTGTINGQIDLGAGDDIVENRGQITGDALLRAGNDRWIQLAAATLAGTADGGEGIDTLIFDATQGGTVDAARFGRYRNFERFEQVGNGSVSYSGTIPFDTINIDGGVVTVSVGESLATLGSTTITGTGAAVTVINNGTILGNVALGSADDMVIANGVVAGDVTLGAGNDFLVLQRPLDFTVTGGSGTDTVVYDAGNAAPLTVNAVPQFENMAVSSGVALVDSAQSFGQVDIIGGRLTGLAGSSLSATTFAVGTGGTFGSAGTVNGNIMVAGTLAPGASPGIMRVNGNVGLATGSNSVFELTPTVFDQLLISGGLTIADGTTLTLTGDRPLNAGSALDLIVADNITGSFSTIVKPDSIQGFVARRGNRIQLLGEFAINPAFSRPVREAIAYLNNYLVSGTGNSLLLNQLSTLIGSDGAANPDAFARLTPEAYASAWQVGVDTSLTLLGSARERPELDSGERGLFSFAQGLGSWRRQSGGDAISSSRINSWGMMGGVGWSAADWGIAAFVGYIDSRQTLPTLAARNDVDAYVGGVQGSYRSGPASFGGMLGFNVAKHSIRRPTPSASVTSRHDMFGGMADLWARYRVASDITIKAGVSYIGLDRGVAFETGATPFALRVASAHHDALFIDGGVEWQGAFGSEGQLRPYAQLGARYQLDGREGRALATLPDGGFGLAGYGIKRAALMAEMAAGLRYAVTPGITLSAGYAGAWGAKDRQHRTMAGLSVAF